MTKEIGTEDGVSDVCNGKNLSKSLLESQVEGEGCCTIGENCCRKSSLRNVLSGLGQAVSPSNCCNSCRSWEGVQSPSSSIVNN